MIKTTASAPKTENWLTLRLKVASSEGRTSTKSYMLRATGLAEVAVPRDLFRRILQIIDGLRPERPARC
jgi:propanediol dehydratase small subunit